ncbi:sulfatase [bacterium]|nr:sulfatase [Mariniblastus sp.]MDB4399638.1 sulfatase [bacterium]
MIKLQLNIFIALAFLAIFPLKSQANESVKQPNILWLFQEDLSPWLGCYGYDIQKGQTPTIDQMASTGVRFSRAYVPAPVCSICRSAMITGANQIRFGAHEHRSGRGDASRSLPDGMCTIVDLMKAEGYFCFNVGKTDYNFEHAGLFSEIPKVQRLTPWRVAPKGKPFFGQIQLKGGKINTTKFQNKTDRDSVTIPGDYPQNDIYREVVAEHFDSARMDDGVIGKILSRLADDDLIDSTIVVYFSDHGANNLVRHKQQPTEGGSHVPFIITGPDPWVPAPSVRDDLVSMLDLSATTLAWAGIKQPSWMEGQNLFSEKFIPREFVATARDRCDQTIDRIRSIRTDRFRYTRNFMLDRVLLQPQYRDSRIFVQDLRDGYAKGTLDPKLAKIYFGERPAEELYDVVNDPAQLVNLVDDAQYEKELKRHRKLLNRWLDNGDTGAGNEPAVELRMADNEKWGRGVNSEYESIRKDQDGDGISDDWEQLNQRNPADGKLQFEFNCGGWQNEGWKPYGRLTNICGSQGFLEFDLITGTGSITRQDLKATPDNNRSLIVTIRTSNDLSLTAFANQTKLTGTIQLKKAKEYQSVKIPLDALWKNHSELKSIKLNFSGDKNTTIEIDSIREGSFTQE